MKVRDVMTSPAVTVRSSTGVGEVAELLVGKGFTSVPVTDEDGHLVGIVTEADLIRNRIPADPRIHGRTGRPTHWPRPETASDVMTTSVESLTAGADIADAADMMLDEKIRCFPVVDGSSVVGVITRRDLLRAAIVRDDRDVEAAVAAQLMALDDSGRYRVTVQGGVADIEDYRDDADDRVRAERVAGRVPGVVAVRVHHETIDPF